MAPRTGGRAVGPEQRREGMTMQHKCEHHGVGYTIHPAGQLKAGTEYRYRQPAGGGHVHEAEWSFCTLEVQARDGDGDGYPVTWMGISCGEVVQPEGGGATLETRKAPEVPSGVRALNGRYASLEALVHEAIERAMVW